jgi:ketosteroid isomerase-like protein
MAEDPVGAIRDSYEALNRGEIDSTLAALDPKVVWRESPELPGAGEMRGTDAVRRFLEEYLESWEEFEQEVEAIERGGDRVLVSLHMRGKGRASGLEVDTRYAHLWTVRGGRGVLVEAYRDPEEGRVALGGLGSEGSGRERPASEP